MFVTTAVDRVFVIAAGITGACERDDLLPSVRSGISFGEVVTRDRDYFGATVNRAARLVNVATPGHVALDVESAPTPLRAWLTSRGLIIRFRSWSSPRADLRHPRNGPVVTSDVTVALLGDRAGCVGQ